MKRLCLLLVLLLPAPAWAADAIVTNLVITPASAPAGSDIQVAFDIVAGAGRTGDTRRFAIGFADAGYTYTCNTTNQINWVASDLGIYSNASGYTVDGVNTAMPSRAITDVVGPTTGLAAGVGTTPSHVVITVKVPPEFSGNYRLIVLPNRDGTAMWSTSCAGCQKADTDSNLGYGTVTVTGTPMIKMDLQACRYGAGIGAYTPGAIAYQYKIVNFGEAGVRVTNFDIKFCFYDTQSCWEAQASSNAQMFLPGPSLYCNTYNPASQYTFEEFNTVDCGVDGKANHCHHYTLGGGPIASSMPYFVPPGGGFLESQSPPVFFRPCGWSGTSTNDPSDDYSSFMSWPQCSGSTPGSAWTSSPKIGLYYAGTILCEWSSNSSGDANSGVPHCGSGSGCNSCPPGYMANTARNDTGDSNTICVPIYSPTPTPGMQLTKTADKPQATLGDTITYTINWVNDSSAARTMTIWDTVPANLTYVGCNAPVGSCSQSGGLVTWSLGSQGAGASGSVTFWATVSSYPWLPNWLDQRVAQGPPAPKARELMLGLWAPQGTERR